ncbi:unnamed protein product [Linum tenue]|uniref:Uncharacterized protein n=1 Tax=Linum tenue TaxID=586396 RepID=A0AAV0ILN5_9ROSI|nr:unnamed protein product [Linum tenue]
MDLFHLPPLPCRPTRPSRRALFTQMRRSAVEPNHVTFTILLSTCADFPAEGRQVLRSHDPLLRAKTGAGSA